MKPNEKTVQSGGTKKKKTSSIYVKFALAVVKTVIVVLIALGCAFGGVLAGAVFGYVKNAPVITPGQFQLTKQTSFIYDKDGAEIAQIKGGENRVLVEHNQIPDYMRKAFIAIEDTRFYQHKGVDWKRFIGAAFSYIVNFGDASYGGSTITQQLVKNITGNTDSTIQRKVQEAWQAMRLEKNLSKEQILDNYMNRIMTGAGCYGVQAAAKKFFNKDVKDLSLAECASIAGVTKYPGALDPTLSEKNKVKNKARQEVILKEMLKQGAITQNEYNQAMSEQLKFYKGDNETKEKADVQSYFVDYVLGQVRKDLMKKNNWSSDTANIEIFNGGIKIFTTQDSDIQKTMTEVCSDINNFPANKKISNPEMQGQAALLVLDPYNGQIRGMYGGYGEKKASLTLNRATDMKRPAGSSFKPIADYGPAVDLGLITPATAIDDVPVYMNNKTPDKPYPTNFESGTYQGLIPIRKAIEKSQNVVAAKVFRDILGPQKSIEYLKRVNIDMSEEPTVSMALGGLHNGVNPLIMAGAYTPFANKGVYTEPIAYTKVTDSKGKVLLDRTKTQVKSVAYKETTAWIMTDMMRGVVTYGTAANFSLGTVKNEKGKVIPTAGKTGTSGDFYDKWFVGYSPYYICASWYGYNNNKSIKGDEGWQALRLWNKVMNKVHAKLDVKEFEKASDVNGLIKKSVCIYSGKSPNQYCSKDPRGNAVKDEYFMKGTEPQSNEICDVHISAKVDPTCTDIYGRPLLAGLNCPANLVVEKVFIKRPVPFLPKKPGELSLKSTIVDWMYELPQGEFCTKHGPGSGSASGTVTGGTNSQSSVSKTADENKNTNAQNGAVEPEQPDNQDVSPFVQPVD